MTRALLIAVLLMSCASTETRDLEARIVELEERVRALREERDALHLEQIWCYGVLWAPMIDARVVAVDAGPDLVFVTLDKGRDDGVERGFNFDVYLDRTYKGRVRVREVLADRCHAVVVRTYEERTIEAGDNAATRL